MVDRPVNFPSESLRHRHVVLLDRDNNQNSNVAISRRPFFPVRNIRRRRQTAHIIFILVLPTIAWSFVVDIQKFI